MRTSKAAFRALSTHALHTWLPALRTLVVEAYFLAKFTVMNEAEDPRRAPPDASPEIPQPATGTPPPREIGGRQGPEPTRFGDWELRGRCIDF